MSASSPLVLVVDDDDDARELLSEHLECEGYRTPRAGSRRWPSPRSGGLTWS